MCLLTVLHQRDAVTQSHKNTIWLPWQHNHAFIQTLIMLLSSLPPCWKLYFVVLDHLVRSIHKRIEPKWCQFLASLHLFKGLEAAYRVQVSAFWVSWVQKSHSHTFALERRTLRNGNIYWNMRWREVQCCDFIKNMIRVITASKAAKYASFACFIPFLTTGRIKMISPNLIKFENSTQNDWCHCGSNDQKAINSKLILVSKMLS